MTCSDVQKVLPEVLDGELDRAFPSDFNAHVRSCSACADLISDLKLISSEAPQLAESDEPAPRLWVKIAAELRAEGVIRDSESLPARPVLVPSSGRSRWNAWWLVPVAAAILAAGSYMVSNSHKTTPQIIAQPHVTAPGSNQLAKQPPDSSPVVSEPKDAPEVIARAPQQAPQVVPTREVEPSPSADDEQFLTAVSTRSPSMRATYENQLQAVNADIRETQAYVDQNPGDLDARQHLMDAYQQKALLYQIALDRIQ